jgi:hypothetical protein
VFLSVSSIIESSSQTLKSFLKHCFWSGPSFEWLNDGVGINYKLYILLCSF